MGIYGQDWSSYQSPAPDASGLSFAFIKVTQGLTYVNPLWQQQRAHAHAAGLVVGLYHYPDMTQDPAAEALHFLGVAQPQPGELLALDWEGYDAVNAAVPKSSQAAYKDAWIAHAQAQASEHRVGLYCDKDYWLNVDTTSQCGDFLWIATAGLPVGAPGIQHPWLFQQFADTPADRDFCPLPSTAALAEWAQNLEADMPTTQADAQLNAQVLLATRIPEAKLASGYVPTFADCLNGAKLADTQLTTLTAQIGALTGVVSALAKAVGAAGGLTAEQAQAAAQDGAAAALAELGHTLASSTSATT